MKGTCVSFKLVNYFGERELQVEVIDEKIKSYKRFNSVPNIQPQQGFTSITIIRFYDNHKGIRKE